MNYYSYIGLPIVLFIFLFSDIQAQEVNKTAIKQSTNYELIKKEKEIIKNSEPNNLEKITYLKVSTSSTQIKNVETKDKNAAIEAKILFLKEQQCCENEINELKLKLIN